MNKHFIFRSRAFWFTVSASSYLHYHSIGSQLHLKYCIAVLQRFIYMPSKARPGQTKGLSPFSFQPINNHPELLPLLVLVLLQPPLSSKQNNEMISSENPSNPLENDPRTPLRWCTVLRNSSKLILSCDIIILVGAVAAIVESADGVWFRSKPSLNDRLGWLLMWPTSCVVLSAQSCSSCGWLLQFERCGPRPRIDRSSIIDERTAPTVVAPGADDDDDEEEVKQGWTFPSGKGRFLLSVSVPAAFFFLVSLDLEVFPVSSLPLHFLFFEDRLAPLLFLLFVVGSALIRTICRHNNRFSRWNRGWKYAPEKKKSAAATTERVNKGWEFLKGCKISAFTETTSRWDSHFEVNSWSTHLVPLWASQGYGTHTNIAAVGMICTDYA